MKKARFALGALLTLAFTLSTLASPPGAWGVSTWKISETFTCEVPPAFYRAGPRSA